ncbi:MAG: glycosyltransferase [Cocleimonas sp.]
MSDHKPVTIICMKWGTKYGAEYVNKLYAMVKRNLTIPFQMVCFTDNGEGVNSDVVIKDLPPLDLPKSAPERGWNKLTTLQNNLGGLSGEALFLDLDVVIVDNIDELFSFPAEFAVIRDAKLTRSMIGNTSVYRFKIGRYDDVLQSFRKNFPQVQKDYRNEQAYLSDEVRKKGDLSFWPDAWCPSYKYHCMKKWPFNHFQDSVIPEGAKIIIFHGHPEPVEAIKGITTKWYRPIRPTAWIKDYWRE